MDIMVFLNLYIFIKFTFEYNEFFKHDKSNIIVSYPEQNIGLQPSVSQSGANSKLDSHDYAKSSTQSVDYVDKYFIDQIELNPWYYAYILPKFDIYRDYSKISDFLVYLNRIFIEYEQKLDRLHFSAINYIKNAIKFSILSIVYQENPHESLDHIIKLAKLKISKLYKNFLKKLENKQPLQDKLTKTSSLELLFKDEYIWNLISFQCSRISFRSDLWPKFSYDDRRKSIGNDFKILFKINRPCEFIHELCDPIEASGKDVLDSNSQNGLSHHQHPDTNRFDRLHKTMMNSIIDIIIIIDTFIKARVYFDQYYVECVFLMTKINSPDLVPLRYYFMNRIQVLYSRFRFHNPIRCLPNFNTSDFKNILSDGSYRGMEKFISDWKYYHGKIGDSPIFMHHL